MTNRGRRDLPARFLTGLWETAALIGSLALLALWGCERVRQADYTGLRLVEVSGRVTLGGQPLVDADIRFESEDTTFSYGRTDKNGDYELRFNSEQPGCLPGEKIVRIRRSAPRGDDDPDADVNDDLPAKYNTESNLRANVTPKQRRFDFEL